MIFTIKQEELYKSITTLTGKTVRTKNLEQSDLYTSLIEISTGTNYRSVIEKLRAIQNNNERQDYKKSNLPFFTIGEFENNVRKKYSFVGTQYAIYDFDHLGNFYAERWNKIVKDSRVFAAFRSPSGDGIKMICMFDDGITDSNLFSELYKYYAAKFEIELGGEADKTSDCSRACFISYDPDIYINPDSEALSTNVILHEVGTSKKTPEQRKELLGKLQSGVKIGEPRTPVLTSAIGMLLKNGIDRELALACALGLNKLNEDPLDKGKIIYTVNDLYDRYRDQSLSERTENFYSYRTSIVEARIVGDVFSLSEVGTTKFYVMVNAASDYEQSKFFTHVVKNNHLHALKRIDYKADVIAEKSFYKYDNDQGIFDVHIPPTPVKIKDNDFVEKYLGDIFGGYKNFIKEWMAVYCYTNYKKLPTLILTGKRGTSKSTFTDLLSGIFPSLSTSVMDMGGAFNPEADKKLMVIDESTSSGKVQYSTLKKYSGQRYNEINEKFIPKYQVMNNLNIAITSNDDLPITVEREEAPENENLNQFFVYKFKKLNVPIDPEFTDKLLDRIGYYVRTELKTVFDSLCTDGYRYSIRVPITDEEKLLFQNSFTEVESDSDDVISKLELSMSNPNFEWFKFVKAGYIPRDYFDNLYGKNHKSKIIKDLQRRGFLTTDNSARNLQIDGKRPYSYKIGDKWLVQLQAEMQRGLSVGSVAQPQKDMFD